ncbi:MAG: site-specific DNA-methyltransferase [Chloroflexi bacterium]|nr:site-specific DNA-methyltransferase [Chloroflexota bacterium]
MKEPDLPLDQILLGDSIELLETLPEKSVDLIFADPPYNLQLKQELWRPNMTKVGAVDDKWDKFKSFSEYDVFTWSWLNACRRVLKDTGTLWVIGSYHNIYRVGSILMDLDYWILNDCVWTKINPMPNFRGVRFTNAHETLLWAQKKKGAKYTFNYQTMKSLNNGLQMRSDWKIPICTGKERIKLPNGDKAHTTQKPEALLERVILASSHRADVVLDPFFGTGTTGAVAKRLGRHWIGIERDKTYIKLAKKRIDDVAEAMFTEDEFLHENKRARPRIPFTILLDQDLLKIGQKLFFGADGGVTAIIVEGGKIKYGKRVGSIHTIGSEIQNAPCNGWQSWYYLDEESGERFPIDRLREKVRKQK